MMMKTLLASALILGLAARVADAQTCSHDGDCDTNAGETCSDDGYCGPDNTGGGGGGGMGSPTPCPNGDECPASEICYSGYCGPLNTDGGGGDAYCGSLPSQCQSLLDSLNGG